MPYAFSSAEGSVFECALDFDEVQFANINFLDSERRDIPFHLSFRFRRQVMVHNRRTQGAWGKENPTPVILEKSGNTLRVEFADLAATVSVNGARIARIPFQKQQDTAAALAHWVGAKGGVGSIRLSGQAHENRRGRGLLTMDQPFKLEGWGYDPAADQQDLSIVVKGSTDRLPMVVLPMPDVAREQRAPVNEIGVLSLVPGWIWTRVDRSAEAAELELRVNGRPCGAPLVLSRNEILETIEMVGAKGAAATPFELLSSIEHVRFARLHRKISPAAQAALTEAMRKYGVEDFVFPPKPKSTAPEKGRPVAKDASSAAEDDAAPDEASEIVPTLPALPRNPVVDKLKELAPRIGGAEPDEMAEIFVELGFDDLTEDERRGYLLSTTSGFCSADRFEALFAVAEAEGLDAMPRSRGDWTTALVLPFFYLRGDAAGVLETMERLQQIDGWLDIPSLCWTVRKIVSDAPAFLTEAQREDVVDRFLRYVDKIHHSYFGMGPSEDLPQTFVTLIRSVESLTEDMQGWVSDRAVWFFGLSHTFWRLIEDAVEREGLVLPPAIANGLQRFSEVERALAAGDPEAAGAALPRHCAGTRRFRRELAAFAQHSGATTAQALEMCSDGVSLGVPEADDAIVRHLSFPVEVAETPELARVARRALRRLNYNIPRSYHPETQADVARACLNLILMPAQNQTDLEQGVEAAFRGIRLLSSRRSEYLGPGLALSLVTAALLDDRQDLAEAVSVQVLAFIDDLPSDVRSGMMAAPAVRMALFGLRQQHSRSPSEFARVLLERFTPALAQLPVPFDEGAAESSVLRPETGTAAFHDILVVVYSCVPNLETRIPALREAWLNELKARGIPYVIVVGDGDGRREGDVVHLDAPDSYEALPHKTVAMAEWVLKNTPYAHLYKVDDDCFLDAEQAIEGAAYRKFPYYGRALVRHEGETDRIWHHARGSSATACMEIDKSDEPSHYADGGSGYVLNRRAMQALVEGSKTRKGAWLKLVSFMEDKLVGDTLALAGMRVTSVDYHVCILRRNHSSGLSVCRWENAFLPSAATPTQIAHLDSSALQPMAKEVQRSFQLRPLRVWPTYDSARLGWNNVNVELISTLDRLKDVNAEPLCVVGCVRNEVEMLPMFLEHYRKLGVKGFLLADNCSDDGTLEYLHEQSDVVVFSADADYGVTQYGVAWQQAIMANLRMNRWSLVADADEFLVLPKGRRSLPALVAGDDYGEADVGRVFMLDLYPKGPLSEATLASGDPFGELDHCDAEPFRDGWTGGPYNNARTWTSALRHRLLEGSRRELFVAQKYALIRYRPWLRFSAGLHYAAEARVAERDLVFAHFKYHAAFHERARVETQRGQHFNNAEEYRRYLALMSEGRDVLFEEGTSVPWRECEWVQRVLAG